MFMKQKLILLFAILLMGFGSFAQKIKKANLSPLAKKAQLFGVHFNAADFNAPTGIKNPISGKVYNSFKEMSKGFSLAYWKGLTNKIDLSTKVNAMFHDYAALYQNETGKTEIGLELEPSLNFRPMADNALIAPFLSAGLGAGLYSGKLGAYAPLGGGVQVNFNSVTYLFLQAQYKFALNKNVTKDNLFYSIGFAENFKEAPAPYVPPAVVLPVVEDRDGDGILDAVDKCPDVKGVVALQGCPDADMDGITDADDTCPSVAGVAKYKGCPVPDLDKDGVNDEDDKCPSEMGVARYQGCPIPDSDGDGVNDEEDKCPTEKGLKENNGCPVLSDFAFNANAVQFETGSIKLTTKALVELNKGAAILKAHPNLNVAIKGYTDNRGQEPANVSLSQKRSDIVKAYLVKKGIDAARLTATGLGSESPVADNKTAAGRAKNRRVEFLGNN
jgi:OmpA-OmpF porin, OOP family